VVKTVRLYFFDREMVLAAKDRKDRIEKQGLFFAPFAFFCG